LLGLLGAVGGLNPPDVWLDPNPFVVAPELPNIDVDVDGAAGAGADAGGVGVVDFGVGTSSMTMSDDLAEKLVPFSPFCFLLERESSSTSSTV